MHSPGTGVIVGGWAHATHPGWVGGVLGSQAVAWRGGSGSFGSCLRPLDLWNRSREGRLRNCCPHFRLVVVLGRGVERLRSMDSNTHSTPPPIGPPGGNQPSWPTWPPAWTSWPPGTWRCCPARSGPPGCWRCGGCLTAWSPPTASWNPEPGQLLQAAWPAGPPRRMPATPEPGSAERRCPGGPARRTSRPAGSPRPVGCGGGGGGGPGQPPPPHGASAARPGGAGPLEPETCRRSAGAGAVTRMVVCRHPGHHHRQAAATMPSPTTARCCWRTVGLPATRMLLDTEHKGRGSGVACRAKPFIQPGTLVRSHADASNELCRQGGIARCPHGPFTPLVWPGSETRRPRWSRSSVHPET
jgi:hypothetical protein